METLCCSKYGRYGIGAVNRYDRSPVVPPGIGGVALESFHNLEDRAL